MTERRTDTAWRHRPRLYNWITFSAREGILRLNTENVDYDKRGLIVPVTSSIGLGVTVPIAYGRVDGNWVSRKQYAGHDNAASRDVQFNSIQFNFISIPRLIPIKIKRYKNNTKRTQKHRGTRTQHACDELEEWITKNENPKQIVAQNKLQSKVRLKICICNYNI